MSDHHKEESPDVQAPDIIQKLVHDPDIFWRFAVELYEKPGVKESCLEAQDRFGADINLMLLFLWCDWHYTRLSKEAIVALGNTSRLWQTEILGPLRNTRRGMKAASGYREVLAQELEIEKRAQKALIACLSGAHPQTGEMSSEPHVTSYALKLGLPIEMLAPLLDDIAKEAQPSVL